MFGYARERRVQPRRPWTARYARRCRMPDRSSIALTRRGDIDGCRLTRNQQHAGLFAVDRDAYRHALRQPDPVEGGVDIGQQVAADTAFTIGNTQGNALHMSADDGAAAHQCDGGRIVDVNVAQLALLALAFYIE